MKNLIKILQAHGIEFTTNAGKVIANEYLITEDGTVECLPVNLTNYTKEQLSNWLGY